MLELRERQGEDQRSLVEPNPGYAIADDDGEAPLVAAEVRLAAVFLATKVGALDSAASRCDGRLARHGMIVFVADHQEPPNNPERGQADPPQPAPETPEVVDAEIVEHASGSGASSASPTRPSSPVAPSGAPSGDEGQDAETFRQYQQFLEFQRFQEWQRRYGETPPTASAPRSSNRPTAKQRPWYRRALRLLRFGFVRKMLYLFVALLVAMYLYDSMFGGASDTPAGTNPPAPGDGGPTVFAPSPAQAVVMLYDSIATKPADTCLSLTDPARRAFAEAHNAPDCETAARRLHSRVKAPAVYKNPDGVRNALDVFENKAVFSACDLRVSGGPALGRFELTKQTSGGWMVSGYERDPNCQG